MIVSKLVDTLFWTVSNIDAFYEAFDIKEGDAMYLPPEERVRIW